MRGLLRRAMIGAGSPSRSARALRWALFVPGCLWLMWLLAVHVFLWTPLLRSLLAREDVRLDYRAAWSVWPGTVHVRGFLLVILTGKEQIQLGIERVQVAVELTDLPRRIFHCKQVRVSGIDFRLRRLIPVPELTPERLEGLPPIMGYGPVPLKTETPDDQVPDWRYKNFSVWLEDIEGLDLQQVWIQNVRVHGLAQVGGSFYLKPGRQLFIQPGELRAESLAVDIGPIPLVQQMRGKLQLRLGPLEMRGLEARIFARHADLDVEMEGRLAGVGLLARALGPRVQLSGGAGPLRAALHVRNGQLLPGSSFSTEPEKISARVTAARGVLLVQASGAALDFDSVAGPPPHIARARIMLKGAQLGVRGATDAARLELLQLELTGEPPDLAELPPPRAVALELRGGLIGDAAPLGSLFAQQDAFALERGHGAFAAHLEGPPDRLSGWARASLGGVLAQVQQHRMQGEVAIEAVIGALDPQRGADLTGTQVRVAGAQLVNPDGSTDQAPGWWANAELSRAQLRFGAHAKGQGSAGGASKDRLAAGPGKEGSAAGAGKDGSAAGAGKDGSAPATVDAPLLDAVLTARCRDARPIVGLYARGADLPKWVAGLFAMDDLSVHGSVQVGRRSVSLRDLTADGEGASVRGVYRLDDAGKQGAALLTVHGLSVALALEPGGTSVHLLGPGAWFAEAQAALQPGRALGALPRARRAAVKLHAPLVQTAE